jgi:hypothetical protein
MEHKNRVIVRQGARKLTPEEVSKVSGGESSGSIITIQTFNPVTKRADGDAGE